MTDIKSVERSMDRLFKKEIVERGKAKKAAKPHMRKASVLHKKWVALFEQWQKMRPK